MIHDDDIRWMMLKSAVSAVNLKIAEMFIICHFLQHPHALHLLLYRLSLSLKEFVIIHFSLTT